MDDICRQFLADNDVKQFVKNTYKCINRPAYKHVFTGDLLIRCQWVIQYAELTNLKLVLQQAQLIYDDCIDKNSLFLSDDAKEYEHKWPFGD